MDLEAEYNNRARVHDHEQIIEGWRRNSESFRSSVGGEYNLAYGDDPRHVTDIFWPGQDRQGPMVVFMHGGYWQALDKNYFSHMARGVSVYGIPTVVPSYRLCPDVSIGDIIDDMHQLCGWLWERHQRRLVVAGHSAGGHLAAAMAATDWSGHDTPDDLVISGLGISGLYDLRPLIPTSINETLGLDQESAFAASPLLWATPQGVRFEAWVGGAESSEYLRQSASLAACWTATGAPTRYFEVPMANHFTIPGVLGQPDSAMTRALAALCRKT